MSYIVDDLREEIERLKHILKLVRGAIYIPHDCDRTDELLGMVDAAIKAPVPVTR